MTGNSDGERDLRAALDEALAWTGTERIVAAIAHGLGNALGVILNNAIFVAQGVPADSPAAQDAQQIIAGAREAIALNKELALVGCGAPVGALPLDVGALVSDLEPVLRRGLGARVDLRLHIEQALPAVRIEPIALVRAVLAMVLARRDELDADATLELRVRADTANRCVLVQVQGTAAAFYPLRAGAQGLATAAGARLAVDSVPTGLAGLSLVVPLDSG